MRHGCSTSVLPGYWGRKFSRICDTEMRELLLIYNAGMSLLAFRKKPFDNSIVVRIGRVKCTIIRKRSAAVHI
jgi:hypothetical protein